MAAKILVTGGAGYIGSHTVRALLDRGYEVVVIDNMYSGHLRAIDERATFLEGTVADSAFLNQTMGAFEFAAVLHFAAHIEVEESVSLPLKYYRNNVAGTLTLLEACLQNRIKNFIFSSTAAVYGEGTGQASSESDRLSPLNPYGRSKLMAEQMIRDLSASMNHVILRYFNAAGASLDGKLGQSTPRATHLIKTAAEVACGLRPELKIFGTDYETPDGTCVRDYVHVEDLASAHVEALRHLLAGGTSSTYNCGYGRGSSVLDVISAFNRILGRDLPVVKVARRAGDSPLLVANNTRLRSELNWQPKHQNLEIICQTALAWERSLATRPR